MRSSSFTLLGAAVGVLVQAIGCSGRAPAPPPPCDQVCLDGIALRAVRETMRWVYNQKLQGNPVGEQDAGADCLMQGTAHIAGTALSNPLQGATEVGLTFTFDRCVYRPAMNANPDRNYVMSITGTVIEKGTLAVQPSSTTALVMGSADLTLTGTVRDPPIDYESSDGGPCTLDAVQNGNEVAGTLCDRKASFSGF